MTVFFLLVYLDGKKKRKEKKSESESESKTDSAEARVICSIFRSTCVGCGIVDFVIINEREKRKKKDKRKKGEK